MNKILEFQNVSKQYEDTPALDRLSLSIYEGDFICIVGTSGSGKTTLMKMVNGLIKPDTGRVLLRGKDIHGEDLIALRRRIGYAIQGNGLFPHMTVAQNIGYVPRLERRPEAEIARIVEDMLLLVGLPLEMKDRYPDELSGGQQQRVGISRAYANHPDILLMDEPFGAVDSITRYQLQKDLKKIHQKTNCTVIFITHDIYEAFQLSTHILVLDQGRVEQFGTRDEVWNNPASDFVRKLIEMTR